jgi:hypothetical protein
MSFFTSYGCNNLGKSSSDKEIKKAVDKYYRAYVNKDAKAVMECFDESAFEWFSKEEQAEMLESMWGDVSIEKYNIISVKEDGYVARVNTNLKGVFFDRTIDKTETLELKNTDDGWKVLRVVLFEKDEAEKTSKSQQVSGKLITPTSISGVEVIGKTQKELKSVFDKGFRWEFIDYGYDGTGWIVYERGMQLFGVFVDYEEFDVNYEDREIYRAIIYDHSYITSDEFRVGSTAGCILKKYPKAKIDEWAYSDHGIQCVTINDIHYYFHYECEVADRTGLIVEKTCPIILIKINGYN